MAASYQLQHPAAAKPGAATKPPPAAGGLGAFKQPVLPSRRNSAGDAKVD
jgi:hypothetical protein